MLVRKSSKGACQVLDSSGQTITQFAFMTAISAQSGIHRPAQVYCLLHVADTHDVDPAAGDPFVGLMLELSTSDHIEPTGTIYLPRQPGTFGPLKMYTTDLFVEYLLDMPSLTDPTLSVRKVHISVLNFEDFLPSIVKVIGVDFSIGDDDDDSTIDDAGAAVLANEGDHDAVLDGDVASSSCSNALCDPQSHQSLDGTDQLDLLSLLETDSSMKEPPKKRCRRKVEQCEDPKRDLPNEGDVKEPTKISLLDDPCLESFLGDDDIAAFRNVEKLCARVNTASNIFERRATTVDLDDAKSDSDEEAVVGADILDGAAAEPASSSTAASSSSFLSPLYCCMCSYDT